MTLLSALTPSAVRDVFEPRTFVAGLEYARTGRVSEPEISKLTATTLIASASVRGSRGRVYSTQLYVEHVDDTFWATSTCSCPVRVDCKHGVALALSIARDDDRPAPVGPPAWERRLGEVVREIAARDAVGGPAPVPLALEIGIEESRFVYERGHHAGPRLVLRPVRRSARGDRWVKTGAEWTSVGQPTARVRFRTHDLEPILDLLAALQTHHAQWRYEHAAPQLSSFGPRLLPLLRRATEVGVPVAAGPGLSSVELTDEPAVATGDLVRDGDQLRLGLAVTCGERTWSGGAVVPVGAPSHAIALLEGGALLLAPTAIPLPSTLHELLTDTEGLRVPADDADRLATLLQPLGRVITLGSSDGSATVPEPVRPVLRLTVTWRSATDARLAWSWRYGERQCGLDSADALAGLRDRAIEREIRARVPAALTATSRAAEGEALLLAVHELPQLRAIDDVEVVELERPDFRESTAGPMISFEVAEEQTERGLDWLDLAVLIEVEGEQIPLPDVLAALTRGDDHIVLRSGLYVRADRPEFDRLREVVAAASELREADADRISIGKHDLGAWAQLAELGIVDDQAAEWVRRARALSDLTELPRPEPVGLATTLRGYQREGFWWLSFLWQHRLGGILADDMGLGKTLQVLALVQHAIATDAAGPFLVVAPTSVVSAWRSEAARHTPELRVATVSRRADDVAAAAAHADLVVTTYSLLRLEQDDFAGVDWSGLVLDEAQQVKNHRSQTYAAARKIDAPFRLAVTGTPFENRLMELWSLLSITVPGLYPWPRSFTTHVVTPVEKHGDQSALDRFRRRIRPFLLRRTKELVAADLPPKQEQLLEVELNARHRRIYDAHLAKERQRILGLLEDFEQNRVAIFSALTTLRRAALDAALLDPEHDRVGSAKLDVLVDHLDEITAEGHQALVFSQFTSYLTRVETGLAEAGIETTYLDGSTTDRDAVIARFRSGSAPVFLVSLKAGGVGLTLTEADYVFVLDPWWNPAAEAQAVDRAHRIGQTRPVNVYRMIAVDTIEEKVLALQERKAALFARVIDGDGASAAGITAADVRSLFDAG